MDGGCRLDPKLTEFIPSAEVTCGMFYAELMALLPTWMQRLQADPASLPQLEAEIQRQFIRGADLAVTGLMSWLIQQASFRQDRQRLRDESLTPLAPGRWREVSVKLLGGLVMWVTSLYCQPRTRAADRSSSADTLSDAAAAPSAPAPSAPAPSAPASDEPPLSGMNLGLAALGFAKRTSGALESKVALQVALGPSIEFARNQLGRDGVVLDEKAVRRIALECGESLLAVRQDELEQFRNGPLAAGSELAGLRVSVQYDGGRTRIRGDLKDRVSSPEPLDELGLPPQDRPGRSRRVAAKTFEAPWREPKLLTLFVHDEHGRMNKTIRATIDGTFAGPDALAEIIAMHLHRLGAAYAKSITFIADGAIWIWDRIATIKRLAKLDDVPTYEILDGCHATHHVSGALKSLGLSEEGRLPLYREYRTLLRNGQWRRVVSELQGLASDAQPKPAVWTEIAYLEKHGTAGRLSYPYFKGLGLPLGSGAIESSIRRVINQRLKSNSTFWKVASAESMLQLRSQLLTDRWDERHKSASRLRSRCGQTGYTGTCQSLLPPAVTPEANSASTG